MGAFLSSTTTTIPFFSFSRFSSLLPHIASTRPFTHVTSPLSLVTPYVLEMRRAYSCTLSLACSCVADVRFVESFFLFKVMLFIRCPLFLFFEPVFLLCRVYGIFPSVTDPQGFAMCTHSLFFGFPSLPQICLLVNDFLSILFVLWE